MNPLGKKEKERILFFLYDYWVSLLERYEVPSRRN
jgi:hypothetical protein